jgi:hypothetical protein
MVDSSAADSDDEFYNPVYTLGCEYKISRVGYYCMTIRLGPYHIRSSPSWIIGYPGKTHAKSSVAYGPGLVVAHPRQTNEFIIEARDNLGNACSSRPYDINVKLNDFVIGVVGPAIIVGATCESSQEDIQSTGYASWIGGAIPNKDELGQPNSTYTVKYQIMDGNKSCCFPFVVSLFWGSFFVAFAFLFFRRSLFHRAKKTNVFFSLFLFYNYIHYRLQSNKDDICSNFCKT